MEAIPSLNPDGAFPLCLTDSHGTGPWVLSKVKACLIRAVSWLISGPLLGVFSCFQKVEQERSDPIQRALLSCPSGGGILGDTLKS